MLNIQVDINTELLYIRLKLTFNTCSCGIWLVTAFTAALKIYENISRFIPLSDDNIPDFSEKLVVCIFICVR